MEVLHCCLFLRKSQKFFSNCFYKRGWRVTRLEVLSGTGGVAKALALKAVVRKLSRGCRRLPGWSPRHLEYWWGGIFLVSMHMRLEKGRNRYCTFWINMIIPEKTRKQKGKEQRESSMEMLLSAATVLLLYEWVILLMEHKQQAYTNLLDCLKFRDF